MSYCNANIFLDTISYDTRSNHLWLFLSFYNEDLNFCVSYFKKLTAKHKTAHRKLYNFY